MNYITFEDRYSATGTPYPNEDSCKECDGMGLFPCKYENLNEEACKAEDKRITIIGQVDDNAEPLENDGWLIVQCPTCKGTWVEPISKSKE